MVALVYIVLFLALTGHSSASYCVCKNGLSDQVLQRSLDYACGAGADCTPILPNGACYQPNTVKSHCDWAVNSYFQRRSQAGGSCDFSGTATQSQTPPTTQNSNCLYSSSAGTSTPTGTPSSSTGTGTTSPITSFGISPTGTATGIPDGSNAMDLFTSLNLFYHLAIMSCFSGFLLLWG